MTDSIGFYGEGAQAANTSAYWQDLYNRKLEWGPCYYDTTHNVTGSSLTICPSGADAPSAKLENHAVDAVLGGWQANAIVSLHGGFPITISANDNSKTSSRGARANCLAPGHVFGEQNSPAGGYQWFDPTVYGLPAPYTFGSCGVSTVRGPGLTESDASISKKFSVTEESQR